MQQRQINMRWATCYEVGFVEVRHEQLWKWQILAFTEVNEKDKAPDCFKWPTIITELSVRLSKSSSLLDVPGTLKNSPYP
jgi:hypothetical protein